MKAPLRILLCLLIGMLGTNSSWGGAPVFKTLSAFGYSPAVAIAGLVPGPDGYFWGISSGGGANATGTIYKVKADGTGLAIVHSFSSLANGPQATNVGGNAPLGALVSDGGGYFWGMASAGGKNGEGTIFKIRATDGAFFTVVNWGDPGEASLGESPRGALAPDGNGYLYGTTVDSLFRVRIATGTLTTLRSFDQQDASLTGAFPDAGPVVIGGVLWGTTTMGGAGGYGTIYQVNLTTHEAKTVVEFTGEVGNKGARPESTLVSDSQGMLWGTTFKGGRGDVGTVFKLDPTTGTLTTVVEFTGTGGTFKGSNPYGALANDGAGMLWGTTTKGGASDRGTIFKIDPATGEFTLEAELTGAAGSRPYGTLCSDGAGHLLGTASANYGNGPGGVYSIDTTSAQITFTPFQGWGATPGAGFTADGEGQLWGVTNRPTGPVGSTIFKVDPQTGTRTTVAVLSDPVGSPSGKLLFDGAHTFWGVAATSNNVFTVDANTGQVTPRVTFTGATGAVPGGEPAGGLIESGGYYWGTTTYESAFAGGTVFKIDPGSGQVTNVANLNVATAEPSGPLADDGQGWVWGVSASTVFKVNTSSGQWSVVVSFDSLDGQTGNVGSPAGGLVNDGAGFMWGMSTRGPVDGLNGGIYKVNIATGQLTSVLGFTGVTGVYPGAFPEGELVLDASGNLWGTTGAGGAFNNGTLFRFNPTTGEFLTFTHFRGAVEPEGASPLAPVTVLPDGSVVGVTIDGRARGYGTIFKLSFDGAGPAAPLAAGQPASALAPTSVTLNGEVEPYGASTMAYFEYGLTAAYGLKTAPQAVGSGLDLVPCSGAIAGLRPHSTYHFRVVAVNSKGARASLDNIFQTADTPPVAHDILAILSGQPSAQTSAYRFSGAGSVSDPDGDKITFDTITLGPGDRWAEATLTGAFLYDPKSTFVGQSQFAYGIDDGHGGTATGNVYVLNGAFDGFVTDASSQIVGRVSLSLTSTGRCTGVLNLRGVASAFAGAFVGPHHLRATIKRGTLPQVQLELDLDPALALVSGTVDDGESLNVSLANGVDFIPGTLGYGTPFAPAVAYHYTAVLPAPSDQTLPQATGYAVLTLSPAGSFSIVGKLGDGTAISGTAPLRADGKFVFYAPLPKAHAVPGWIAGLLSYSASSLTGTLTWSIPQASGNPIAAPLTFQAGRYTPPPLHQQALTLSNSAVTGTITIAGGGLTTLTHHVSISPLNAVTVTDPGSDGLKLAIVPGTGLLFGTLTEAGHGQLTLLGVIQQGTPGAGGLLIGAGVQAGFSLSTP